SLLFLLLMLLPPPCSTLFPYTTLFRSTMSTYLLLSFRFLTPWFHGRRDEGAPEWPPSPLRVFQALVAAAARAGTLEAIRPALVWLEQREAPLVVAPEVAPAATGYRLSVPHNAMDLVGRQW